METTQPAVATPAVKPVVKAVKPVVKAVKPVAVAAKPAKPAKPAKAAKPAAAKLAKAAKTATVKAARGEGAKYISPEEKAQIQALIKQKVRKPMTTKDVGVALGGLPAWKIRKCTRALVAEGRYTMERAGTGGLLTSAPAKK